MASEASDEHPEVMLGGKRYRQTPSGVEVYRLISARRAEHQWVKLEAPSNALKLLFKRLEWRTPHDRAC